MKDIGRVLIERFSWQMKSKMAAKQRTKRNMKKETILQSAMDLFLEKGYSATSTNDICSVAKINKPTLYYYFESKRHLFATHHMRHINETLTPYLEVAGSIEDPWERFVFMIRQYTKIICQHPELRVLIHETLSIKNDYFEQVRMEWKKHYLLLRDTISQLQSSGKAPPDLKPSWAALLLLGMITWITFWLDYSQQDKIHEVTETALKLALFGLFERKIERQLIERRSYDKSKVVIRGNNKKVS